MAAPEYAVRERLSQDAHNTRKTREQDTVIPFPSPLERIAYDSAQTMNTLLCMLARVSYERENGCERTLYLTQEGFARPTGYGEHIGSMAWSEPRGADGRKPPTTTMDLGRVPLASTAHNTYPLCEVLRLEEEFFSRLYD